MKWSLGGMAGLALAVAAAPASAADWTVGGALSQRIAVNHPQGDSGDGGGGGSPELSASTSLDLSVAARTPVSRFALSSGVAFVGSTDEGAATSNLLPRLSGGFSHRASPRLAFSGSVSLVPELAESDGVFDIVAGPLPPPGDGVGEDDLGEDDPVDDDPEVDSDRDAPSERDALRLSGGANIAASYALTPVSSVSAGLSGALTRFVGGGDALVASENYGFNLGLSRRLDPMTSVSISGRLRFFSSEEEESRAQTVTLGMSRRLTPQLSTSADVGASYVVSRGGGEEDGEEEDSILFSGGARAAYRLEPFSVGLSLSQSLDQNDLGELEAQTTLSASLGYAMSPFSQLSFSGRLARETPALESAGDDGGSDLAWSVGSSLSHRFAEEWTGSVGYSLRSLEDGNSSIGSLLFVQVSRALTLLP